jgi:phosphatidate cytidylyltransferase
MTWLANLTVTEQVSALFVVLFGGLVLATAAVVLLNLREPDLGQARQQERRLNRLRELRALWAGALLFWVAWIAGPLGATLLAAACAFLVLREFITLVHTRRGDHRSLLLAFFLVLPAQFVFVGTRSFDLFSVFIPVYVFLAIPVVSALAGDPERFLERNAVIQWGIMVCIFGFSHLPALLLLELPRYDGRGAFLIFFIVVVTSIAKLVQDSFSRRLRRRPAARRIDRSFSWRCWGTGIVAAALSGAALWWITPFDPLRAAAMGALAGGCGTLGELVMHALKRDAGVRYWGNRSSVTGAVGLLDRVAALCFAAPIFFHSVRWFFRVNG